MKHKLVIAIAVGVVVLGVGSTVAWAATHGSFSGHMGPGHMQQAGNGHMMGQVSQADMRKYMARIHPGFDAATLDKLAEQCTKAMKDVSSMHGPNGMGDWDDMMGGSSGTGMMGGSGGMMGGSSGGMMSTT